ncbi:hypothetical protein LBE40_05115 [Bartonella taylorii]|uniref:Phage protein n=1 Tax=Bartonella taylorii 8TBB TaxID=1094560 RepID=A0A9P2W2N0_BARTA|nr:hypothetical protein [Bartonella taylorii]EJF93440.1 hypothetical protein ME9_01333 [Bartonella taylorii 8TBB]USP00686.1 hypothetical protein LBE40_05115 [Bartonella taylorii]
MKQILKLLSGLILLSVAGCDIDKLGPSYRAMWEKPGADSTEVGKALLECGMPTPYSEDSENREVSNNGWATIHACMIQAGFHYKDQRGGGWCYTYKEENLPICRPGAVIPQRSVEKRLNSPFCKQHPEQYECYP